MLMDRAFAAQLGHETLAILKTGLYTAPSGAKVDLSADLDRCRTGTVEYPPDEQLPPAFRPASMDT